MNSSASVTSYAVERRGHLSRASVTTPTVEALGSISVAVTSDMREVEEVWRDLSDTVESPGQSYDFIRLWVDTRGIPAEDQRYVVGKVDGVPVALLPLHRRTYRGFRFLGWFPGPHVGCNAPVADLTRLAALGSEGRCALWQAMTRDLKDVADFIYLREIPAVVGGVSGLFDELGATLDVETLYRSQYDSWQECDSLQRSKSRRKHDRQQCERLQALGDVSFEELGNGDEGVHTALAVMFRQRSARFRTMGIRDTFVKDGLTGFYQDLALAGSGTDIRLHVLRLNGEIVAVRYNVVHGERMFCLISSMSEDLAIQSGSPGKQCLLRVMQSVFDRGTRVFDMGSGFTDEKRHWCNVRMPLRSHYVGLSLRGRAVIKAHRLVKRARAVIKANPHLKSAVRGVGMLWDRVTGPLGGLQTRN